MAKSLTAKETQGLSSRERSIISNFMRKGRVTVKGNDVEKEFNISRPLANKILSRLEKKGWLKRSKRGIYVFVPLTSTTKETVPEDPWLLAMELFKPCYISGFTAAEYWGLTEQVFNTIVVYTTQRQRSNSQKLTNVSFYTHYIPESNFFGTQKIWRNNIPVLIADIHRNVIDVLANPKFGGGGSHTMDIVYSYWKSDKADPGKLFQYAAKIRNKVIFKRLGFSAELWGNTTKEWLDECRKQISNGISKMDPSGENKGKIITRWKLRINVLIEEYK